VALGRDAAVGDTFRLPDEPEGVPKGYTLAQKMVGKACGTNGVVPGQYCEPAMTTVGSQDTTGPMTRDELKSLACLGFSADLVMQSFCHTAAYPKPVDVVTHHTLPDFIRTRGGVSLRPGDGIIHSWLNRMLVPDTVGTGGDSHTRFPIGISFPAGSGLVAFAGATGVMPLDMPESVLVRFSGEMQPGVTLRDLVQAIPYTAQKMGLLTTEKQGKINVFSGRVLEIEGLPDLKCEQAFELSDASAERSAAGCSIKLNEEPIAEYLRSNVVMLKWMIAEGYGDARTLERRIARMEEWLADPVLLEADADADKPTKAGAKKAAKVAKAVKGSVATVKTGADLLKSATNTNNRKPSQTIPGCPPASTVLGEVKEIITMPKFNIKAAKYQEDPESIHLDAAVEEQLHDYVSNIAALYHGNSFHNFEHASHVAMSVVKLLSRIVAPIDIDGAHNDKKGKQTMASNLHDHTYGITSDPLTQFACIISALIHDVDHPGVPNAQLVKENSHLAQVYNGKSVAEQNSVDLAWALLMDKRYGKLRATIFQTDAELKRFRQLVVNSVMATDIIDKDLKQLRNARWDAAFSEAASQEESSDDSNRKATIVIEHLIQASDVAHTMQHWHIYRKWNERFFLECFISYREGRAKDPTTYWYEGELGFFDFYIIPLAKKLKDCGSFGVSSDEYLNYAVRNRDEWEFRGKEIVAEMVELANRKLDIDVPPEVPVVSAL